MINYLCRAGIARQKAKNMPELNIETLVKWSAGKRVDTINGPRLLRTAFATQEFWAAWKAGKEALKAAGVSCAPAQRNNPRGDWEAKWWLPVTAPVPGAPAPEAAAAIVAQVTPKVVELSPEQLARLKTIAPKLLPYQVASVGDSALALAVYRGSLDASDTGTGKTYVAIATAAVLGKPLFVVCPIAVLPSWKIAAKHFGIKLLGSSNYELLRRGNSPELSIFKVMKKIKGKDVEVDEFRWNLPADAIIAFDECHRMKDPKTLNNAMGMAALNGGYSVLGLSATAADNPMQMKFAARLTGQVHNDKQFFGWMLRHGVVKGRWGFEFTGGKAVLGKLHHDIFPAHGTRVKIADLGDAFPETQIGIEMMDFNGASSDIERIYREMDAEIARIEASEAEDKGACILTARLRARQRAEICKVPGVVAYVQDKIEEGMSVALFVNFDDTIFALAEKLKTKSIIRGGQSAEDRERVRLAFHEDREHIVLCNIKAGGVGISLHGTRESRMRFSGVFPTDSAQDIKQAFGRVWRAGGAKSIQRVFVAVGTIEEAVYGNSVEKIGRIDSLNDGDGQPRLATVTAEPVAPKAQPAFIPVVQIPDAPKAAPSVPGAPAPVAPAIKVSEELREFVHGALQQIAGQDSDRARAVNGIGFSKFDGEFGHSLADRSFLTDKMVLAGARLARKYQRQLGGAEWVARLDSLMTKNS